MGSCPEEHLTNGLWLKTCVPSRLLLVDSLMDQKRGVCIQVGNSTITVVQGDITESSADVIINSTDTDMSMGGKDADHEQFWCLKWYQ